MIDYSTLTRRCLEDIKTNFTDFFHSKKAKGETALRCKQYEVAMNGNIPMLIWLGKNRLDQRNIKLNQIENTMSQTVNFVFDSDIKFPMLPTSESDVTDRPRTQI